MIQPTNGPRNPDPNERSGDPAAPSTQPRPSTPAGTPGGPAPRRDIGGSSRENPAQGPAQHLSGSDSTTRKDEPEAGGPLPTPSEHRGIRQVKGDENRASQEDASGESRSGDRSTVRGDGPESRRTPPSGEPSPPRRGPARPQDPAQPEHETPRPEPTQPNRPATIDPPTGRTSE